VVGRRLLSPADVGDLARRYGIVPTKALGQNFVIDQNTIRRIVRLAGIAPEDRIIEVGAGVGTLTLGLAEAAQHVTAIELDRRLIPALEEVLDGTDNVDVWSATPWTSTSPPWSPGGRTGWWPTCPTTSPPR
jgi:protein-L-isoaspartate O-methyltransferase